MTGRPPASQKRRWAAAVLAGAVLAAFSPCFGNGFVGYDDPGYVTGNPQVSAGLTRSGLVWAATALHQSNWHPLTWVSHMADVSLFGLAPAGHHATSVLLHLANALLLFGVLARDTGAAWPAALAAFAFALHPLRVESVAWVAERKDVLSALFWLLALRAYGSYARRPGAGRYAAALALFAAGLASKPMVVTLPAVLLLWDVWPLRRSAGGGRRLAEKLPFFVLAALSAAMTVHAQRAGGSLVGVEPLPIGARIGNALVSYVAYPGQIVWPAGLAAFYPHPAGGLSPWRVAGAAAIVAAATAWTISARRRRPWLAVGWLWYLVTLLPVVGLVQVGLQARADRYTYLPTIGLLVAAAWTADEAARRCSARTRRWAAAVAAAVLAVFAAATWRQAHVWRDGVTLWTHALGVTEGNFIAHNNLGVELDERGRHEEALRHYAEVLRLEPGDRNGTRNYAMACFARGERWLGQGDPEAALASFREGLRLRPDDAEARRYVEAIEAALRTGTPSRSR